MSMAPYRAEVGANVHFSYSKIIPLALITVAAGIIFYTVNVKLGKYWNYRVQHRLEQLD